MTYNLFTYTVYIISNMTYMVQVIRKHDILSQSLKETEGVSQNTQVESDGLWLIFFWCGEIVVEGQFASGETKERPFQSGVRYQKTENSFPLEMSHIETLTSSPKASSIAPKKGDHYFHFPNTHTHTHTHIYIYIYIYIYKTKANIYAV